MAARRRSGAGARRRGGSRGADLSRPSDGRGLLHVHPACAARRRRRSSTWRSALGYGEENDLCLRAARAGWRNVLADNAFVVHTGGSSFAGQKTELGARNMALLLERHPHYLDMVRSYIAADPLRPLRDAAAMRLAVNTEPGPRRAACDPRSRRRHRDARARADRGFARSLAPLPRDRRRRSLAGRGASRRRRCCHVRSGTRRAGVMGSVRRRHLRVVRHRARPPAQHFRLSRRHPAALETLPVPYGYTVHDLNFACPTITFLAADGMYCGAQTETAVCSRCLAAQPAFDRVDIGAWRDAPSRAARAGGVPDCAVAMDCRHAEAILSGLSGDGDRARFAGSACRRVCPACAPP